MLLKNIVIYFVDDMLNIVYNNRVININLKNILNKGIIIHKQKFMEEFISILKREKIKGKLFGDTITIVKNNFYNDRDLFYLESIFTELGFLKVNFLDINELLPDDSATYIEINNSYICIYLDKCVYLDLDLFKDIPKILDYFNDSYHENIILFGLNKNIPNINIKNKYVYYLQNYNNYITESLLKVKKYGV